MKSDQGHLTGVGFDYFSRWGFSQVIVTRVKTADQFIEIEGRLPNITKKTAARTVSRNGCAAIHGGVEALVPGATALEFARADLQEPACSRCGLDLLDVFADRFGLALHGLFEIADSFSHALG